MAEPTSMYDTNGPLGSGTFLLKLVDLTPSDDVTCWTRPAFLTSSFLGCKSFFFSQRTGQDFSIQLNDGLYRTGFDELSVFVRTGVNGFLKGASERGSVF